MTGNQWSAARESCQLQESFRILKGRTKSSTSSMMKLRAIEKFLFKEDILRADFKNLQEGIKEDVT